jgi:adenylate cyclase
VSDTRVQRRLAAVLAADIVGYSRMMEADEAGTRRRVNVLQSDIVDPMVAQDGGRVVKTTGDGILIEFPSAVDAVRNALRIQKAVVDLNMGALAGEEIEIRVGINVGDLIIEGDDIHGDGVNIAARLEGVCEPGKVYVSQAVAEYAAGKVNAAFSDLGDHTLKNISRPIRVFQADESDAPISPDRPEPKPMAAKPSIAVLPFNNMSGDPDQEYFSDGITEDIITTLSQIRQFFVVARNSTFTFKGQPIDVQAVAAPLGVRYVLEGSVRKAGNRLRITAQLIEGDTGNHLWAERYDRNLEDIFDIQDEITQTVTGAMDSELGRAEQQRALAKPPDNLDAWDLHQRGMFHMYRRTRNDNVEALRFFRLAIERDPNFSGPHGCMARTQIADILLDYMAHDPDEILQNAQRAVDLDDQDAKAHYALGITYVMAKRDGEAANRAFEEGRRINPNDAQNLNGLAKSLTCLGRAEEAESMAEEALRLSPSDQNIGLVYGSLCLACLCQEKHAEAMEWGRKSQQKTLSWIEWIGLPAALAFLGRDDEARAVSDDVVARWPNLTASLIGELQPVTHAPYLDHLVDGLIKAGMPR